ncbi:hypothetical protein IU433_20250 [Nocardia puris]|uniref:Uncharacterized protein n=1 Tax=Nocardia puris TaxID=208602 RepID=A0A366E208_9NOCA|nr:hypothetical protein [Nocardia puris]MBF6212776.1 hypothetical protein [Nocardia puris]MBF6367713.1 hypothetical protein [Nocardia puris]MBF6461364.1 hypothetical protein [Nocardia puris]RBO96401.1 hypothetical protein DFR74_101416 [Nocardia puris]
MRFELRAVYRVDDGLSVVLGWLYNAAGANTMVAVVAHTVSNVCYGFVAAAIEPRLQWVDTVVMACAGLAILVLTRGRIGVAPGVPGSLSAHPESHTSNVRT